jgi:hypothetical protein
MNYNQTIYDPTKTLIITGDSNLSKTTTINALLQTNFYTASGTNKTIITTIFKFSDEYSLNLTDKNQKYNNIEDLTNAYNNASQENNIFDCNILVTLKTDCIKDLVIIDTIGKSLKYPSDKLDSKILELQKIYPNNLIIELVKQPNQNCFTTVKTCKNKIYIVAFADMIDYAQDENLECIHSEFLDMIDSKKMFFNSNVQNDKIITIKNKFVRHYGLNTVDELFNTICNSFDDKIKVKTIDMLEEDSIIKHAKSIHEIENALYYYNNDYLMQEFKKYVNIQKYVSNEKMYKICDMALDEMNSKENVKGYGPKRLCDILISHFKNNSFIFDRHMINFLENTKFINIKNKMYNEVFKLSRTFTNNTKEHLFVITKKILFENIKSDEEDEDEDEDEELDNPAKKIKLN